MTCVTSLPNCSSASRLRIFNEIPGGAYDCVNQTYTTSLEFDPTTLIIRLDGVTLDPTQYIIDAGNQGFTLVIDPNDAKALSDALGNDELLRVDYDEPISSGTTGCLSIL